MKLYSLPLLLSVILLLTLVNGLQTATAQEDSDDSHVMRGPRPGVTSSYGNPDRWVMFRDDEAAVFCLSQSDEQGKLASYKAEFSEDDETFDVQEGHRADTEISSCYAENSGDVNKFAAASGRLKREHDEVATVHYTDHGE